MRSLSTKQEVPGSIPGYAVRLFSNGGLLHGVYGLDVSVFFLHFAEASNIPICELF